MGMGGISGYGRDKWGNWGGISGYGRDKWGN